MTDTTVQNMMHALADKAEVGFEHVEAVVKRLLHKLHLDADNDAANAKKHIEELAAATCRHDVVLPAFRLLLKLLRLQRL